MKIKQLKSNYNFYYQMRRMKSNKNTYNKLETFCSKSFSYSPLIRDRNFTESTLDIPESVSTGGLLIGTNQKQLLTGIKFNGNVSNWALNQEKYETAFAELDLSKSKREIVKFIKKERLCKLESIKEIKN